MNKLQLHLKRVHELVRSRNPVQIYAHEVLMMARGFVPIREIASAIFGSERSVSKFLKEQGVPTKRANACDRNEDLVLQLARDGVRGREIARRIGANERHVRAFLDARQIPRSRSFASHGPKNPAWKGGRIVTTQGYVKLWVPNHPDCNKAGYVWEHRLVMEAMIGRRLLPKEVVHHKNKKPADNRPENLQLFSENSEHLRQELKGQCPKWSPEGYERIQKGVNRWRESRREHNRKASKLGVSQLK